MLHPNQFQVNEAWIAFRLNSAPVRTEKDGEFNCVALMDAASCFIFGMVMAPTERPELSKFEVRRLLKKGWDTKRQYPDTLFVPTGRFDNALPAEAERQGIVVVRVPESQLLVFTGEARQSFKDHFDAVGAGARRL